MEQATMDAQLAAAQQVVNMAKLIQEEQERMAQSEAAEAARLQFVNNPRSPLYYTCMLLTSAA
jgi:hypothetical protein